MKALYVTSVDSYSGKTALCLALGKHFQSRGHSIAYLKPLSTQPWRRPDGKLVDEDAAFVQATLGLASDQSLESPIVVTPETLRERLKLGENGDLLTRVQSAAERLSKEADVLLIEGGASLREGYAMGISNPRVAKQLGAPVIVIVRYRGEMAVVDDTLTAQYRLGDQLLGAVLNHVPEEAGPFVEEFARPFLEGKGIPILGTLPDVPRLAALAIDELVGLLNAEVLTESANLEALADTFTVGAMNAEAALARFRRQQKKVVITGGDRTDIQLAALETSTVALVLTGHLQPSPMVVRQAESMNVPVLLVKENTMETVEAIEGAYGKTRLGQAEKLQTFVELVEGQVDLGPVRSALGID